jgi:hypothetical protein
VFATRVFPVRAMIFIAPFPAWNALALVVAVGLAAGHRVAALLLAAASLAVLGWLFARSPLRKLSWRELALYAGVGFVVNWTCMLASVRAGLRKRRLFFYPGI